MNIVAFSEELSQIKPSEFREERALNVSLPIDEPNLYESIKLKSICGIKTHFEVIKSPIYELSIIYKNNGALFEVPTIITMDYLNEIHSKYETVIAHKVFNRMFNKFVFICRNERKSPITEKLHVSLADYLNNIDHIVNEFAKFENTSIKNYLYNLNCKYKSLNLKLMLLDSQYEEEGPITKYFFRLSDYSYNNIQSDADEYDKLIAMRLYKLKFILRLSRLPLYNVEFSGERFILADLTVDNIKNIMGFEFFCKGNTLVKLDSTNTAKFNISSENINIVFDFIEKKQSM